MLVEQRKSPRASLRVLPLIVVLILLSITTLLYFTSKKDLKHSEGTQINIEGTITAMCGMGDGSLNIIGTQEEKVVALDKDGKKVWDFNTVGPVMDIKADSEYIYASSDKRIVYVLDKNGTLLKEIKVSYRPAFVSGSYKNERVLIGGTLSALKNALQMYDLNGEKVYSERIDEPSVNVFLVENAHKMIHLSKGGAVVLLDAEGNEISRQALEYTPVDSAYSPELNRLIVSDEGNNIYAFDGQLNQLWKVKLDEKVNVLDIDSTKKQVLAATNEGHLVALDETGKEKLRIESMQEAKLLSVNSILGEVYLVKDENQMIKYSISAISGLNKGRTTNSILVYLIIILLILLILAFINVIPKLRETFFKSLLSLMKQIFRSKLCYLVILPSIILLAIFNYYPAFFGLVMAFYDYKPGAYMHWVGLENFKAVFHNEYFWTGISNMLIFLATDLLKCIIPPIIFAELIIAMKSKQAQYWTRVALYVPGILPGIAGLLVWTSGILSMDGIINLFLKAVGLGQFATSWLGNSNTAIWSLVFIGFPWIGSYIIFYGALMGVPESLYDASKIDGCGWWRRIVSIDMPMISPQIKFIFVTTFIGSLQNFALVYVTTLGGPGHSTYTPMLELYLNMARFQNYGEAAAMGIMMFVAIFCATLFNLKIKTTETVI